MTMEAERIDQPTKDPVSNVLKWVLLVVALASFAILGWTNIGLTFGPGVPIYFFASVNGVDRPVAPGTCGGLHGHVRVSPDGTAYVPNESCFDANNVSHGFMRTPGGEFTTFAAPGAGSAFGSGSGTLPDSINEAGAITGHYSDAHRVNHGFLQSP